MMTDTLAVAEINELIEQHSDKAPDAIAQIGNICQQDRAGRTPLNVAIQSRNYEIIRLLAEFEEAVNFSPKIDADLLSPVKHSVSAMFRGDNIEETEDYLLQSFGPHTCWQRTPLHTACRYADPDAIALLISKNADPGAKDILGLSPLELCLQFGEADVVDRFINGCVEQKRKLKVGELALERTCSNTTLYSRLVQLGTLDIKAKRFAFSRACALLDKEGIENLLQQGLDINKTMSGELSPIREICTSRLLFLYEHPEAPRLAGQYAAAQDAGAGGITISNDDILNAKSLEDIEALFSDSIESAANQHVEQSSYMLSEEERQSQLSQRLALIDFLVEQGLDTGIAERKAPFDFLSAIVSSNSPDILQSLLSKGFSLQPQPGFEDKELHLALRHELYAVVDPLLQLGHQWGELKKRKPDLVQGYLTWKRKHEADIVKLDLTKRKQVRAGKAKSAKAISKSKWTWELAGESMLLAETEPQKLVQDKPVIVRLTHNNVYGPVDEVQLFVRVGNPDKPTAFEDLASGGEWHPMALVEELLTVDGEKVERSSVEESVFGETPWEGTYECKQKFKAGRHSIEIKVVSDIEGMTGVIPDWLIKVN